MDSYLWLAAIIAFVSVFIPCALASLIHKGKRINLLIGGIVASLLYGGIWFFMNWKAAAGFYAPIPFVGSAFLGFLFSVIVCLIIVGEGRSGERNLFYLVPPLLLFVMSFLVVIWIWVEGWDIFTAKEKAELIGKVAVKENVAAAITPADTAHICLVDEDMATVTAQNALSELKLDGGVVAGSRYKIGQPTKQYTDGQLWWIFPLEFQGWRKWKQYPEVPGYLRVSAEDPFAKGEAVRRNKQGKKISIRYLNSACWQYQAERYLRQNGYMYSILFDWTLESDDFWNPYYTVTVAERTMGYDGLKVLGVVALNLQTGEHKFYATKNVPLWVDRVIPDSVVEENLENWGQYAEEGWWYNVWHDDKAQNPSGKMYLTYDPERAAQWFRGFTSTSSSDKALTGFTVTEARTMDTVFFRAVGVTEDVAYDTARSLWSNYKDYEPSELVPYNIDGLLTYVIPMKFKDQFKGVSLVSLSNINMNGKGKTLEEALANYRASRVKGADRIAPGGGALPTFEIRGIIERIGIPIPKSETLVMNFMVKGISKRFQVPDSYKTKEAVFMEPGQEIVCTYVQTGEPMLTCETFDIVGIDLTDENPAQARLVENQSRGSGPLVPLP